MLGVLRIKRMSRSDVLFLPLKIEHTTMCETPHYARTRLDYDVDFDASSITCTLSSSTRAHLFLYTYSTQTAFYSTVSTFSLRVQQ